MDKKRTLRFITFKLGHHNVIDVDKVGGRNASFEDFLELLPRDSPRFIVYDVNCKTNDGRHFDKLLFAYWCPDEVHDPKLRMMYASAKKFFAEMFKVAGSLRESLDIQIHDIDDMTEETFIKAASKNGKD